jgi:hypothetical protein
MSSEEGTDVGENLPPVQAPSVKTKKAKNYGTEVIFCDSSIQPNSAHTLAP